MVKLCEFCNGEIDPAKTIRWDRNWLGADMDLGDEIPEDEMDLHYFCSVDCLVKWQKQEGIYDEAKAQSIKRSDRSPKLANKKDPKDLKKGFRYTGFKDHSRAG